jgi:hypothetical protein
MSNQLSSRARGRPSTGNSNIINLERQQVSQPAYHSARAHTSSLRASYPPPTIAVPDEIPRSRLRPLTCPQEWIENNSKTDLFDKSGFNVEVADSERKYFAKQFVERNQDSLWKYNTEYIGKTPRTVYKEIAGDYYLHSKITQVCMYALLRCSFFCSALFFALLFYALLFRYVLLFCSSALLLMSAVLLFCCSAVLLLSFPLF